MRVVAGILVFSLLLADMASAQTLPPDAAPAPQSTEASAGATASTPKAPFEYKLGQTTIDAARDYWSQNGMQILQEGHKSLGTGSGMDGYPSVTADKIVLIDVSGVDFEGLSTARYAFYDGKLYSIEVSLGLSSFGQTSPNYTDEQVRALTARLKAKYGAPNQAFRTMYAETKSPDLMIWKRGEDQLVLTTGVYGGLVYTNDKLQADVKKYIKAYCKTVNTKKLITCW